MTQLGKSLVFYLRYPAEMERLYWRPKYDHIEADLTGLENADRIKQTALAVGEAASRQAQDFIEECAQKVETYFRGLGNVTIDARATRIKIAKNWTWYADCRASDSGAWFRCGISILTQNGEVISGHDATLKCVPSGASLPAQVGNAVPWLWRRGGRDWERRVLKLLGDRAHSDSNGGLMFGGGSVALPPIPLLSTDRSLDDVDRDPLIERVVQAFEAIRRDEIEIISREECQAD